MPDFDANAFESLLERCLQRDARRLRSRRQRIEQGRGTKGKGKPAALAELFAAAEEAADRFARRAETRPDIDYGGLDLPILDHRREIVDAVREHRVTVICGETGSGKSTQLPKLCLEAGRGETGWIGHTQPRRIAARSIATRVAKELGVELGSSVGYKVRFQDHTSPDAWIKVMTDGLLLAETQGDRGLHAYDTIIVDEAHERSLNIDFLLGYLRRLIDRRPEFRLVITSATIDPHRFAEHFDDAPVIEVSGRSYPVDVRYRPLIAEAAGEDDKDIADGILDAVDEIAAEHPGDILVFLPGERDIRDAAEALRKHHPPETEILPLFARLSAKEQDRVFQPHEGRRIVLATNVAETSLTVPGVRAVVDTGLARISRYSPHSRVQRLPIEAISQASARQRAGRCGRVGPGVCIRLYEETDFEQREVYTPPEIQRTNLASVILQMKALHLGDVRRFPFLDPPRKSMIRDGYDTLVELGAVDDHQQITELGRKLARLPLDPRIARMIIAGEDEHALTEVLIVAAALSIQDPRERPMEQSDQADEAHEQFKHDQSDFVSLLNIWEAYHEQKRHLSWRKLRRWCRDNFLNFLRMREWHDIHQQIRTLVKQSGMRLNDAPATYDQLHRALLAGLLRNIGMKGDKNEYNAAGGSEVFIFPGSGLFDVKPKWIMAAEIVETTRRYARTVARIQPEWVEDVAAHLVRHSYSEPQWDPRAAQAMAKERVSLFGLELVNRRRVPYGPVDPVAARELFIHHALVEGEWETDAPFFEHNHRLIRSIKRDESKRRKRDLLVDVHRQYDFYDRRVPAHITSGRAFNRWRRKAERHQGDLLFMEREDLIVPHADSIDPDRYPDQFALGGAELPVVYTHDPGDPRDGVSIAAPVTLLARLDPDRLEWLVPGLLPEKVVELIRTLPKHVRRHFVPAPDFARAALDRIEFGEGRLTAALGAALHRVGGVEVNAGDFDLSALPAHLRMLVIVVDDDGEVIAESRDVAELQRRFRHEARAAFRRLSDDRFDAAGRTAWDWDDLPAEVVVDQAGVPVTAYPAIVDDGDSVSVQLIEHPEPARRMLHAGLRRLFLLQCRDELASQLTYIPGIDVMQRQFRVINPKGGFDDALALLTAERAFMSDAPAIRTQKLFQARVESGFRHLWPAGMQVADALRPILAGAETVALKLDAPLPYSVDPSRLDLSEHWSTLLPPNVLTMTPFDRLLHLPRYLEGMGMRIDRLTGGGGTRDMRQLDEFRPCWERWRSLAEAASTAEDAALQDALDEHRWLLEEFRIALFAQEVGTAEPVSRKRIDAHWQRVLAAARSAGLMAAEATG